MIANPIFSASINSQSGILDEAAQRIQRSLETHAARSSSTPKSMKKSKPTHTPSTFAAPDGDTSEPKSALAVASGQVSSAPLVLSVPASDDKISGQALTEQYHRAVGGMREVLKFGVLMMQLRDHLSTVVQARTTVGQFGEKESGSIKSWLAEHAPEIKPSTAFRFLHVAEAVAADFALPANVSFIELATSAPDALSEPLQLKQTELWENIDGTSQKSWLDRLAPPKPRTYHPPKPKSGDGSLPEEPPAGWLPHLWARYRTLSQEQRFAWDLLYIPAFKVFTTFEEQWAFLPDRERDELDGWLLDMRAKIKQAKSAK